MDEEKPACSVVEQAGVPRERVIGGLRDRKGLFYLLTLESIGFVSTEDKDNFYLYIRRFSSSVKALKRAIQ